MVHSNLMPKFMSKSTRLVSLFIAVSLLLFSFSTPLFAAEFTYGGTVSSITGPSTGVVGGSYSFTTVVTSEVGRELSYVSITADNDSMNENPFIHITVPTSTCTDYACTITGNFTPTQTGTFYIFGKITFAADTPGYVLTCASYPVNQICLNSTGKYITFVVTAGGQGGADEDLPSTGLLSNQTKNIYIGLGFIFLGILSTQVFRITEGINTLHDKNTIKKSEKRRSKLEKKFN